jgi:prepilin-type N-terminal cleavage/methylation domain-containing protein/prepilin-type processing-associated H-X9-DG protein
MYRRLPVPAPRVGRNQRARRNAFTLVELLVVITVIAMLVGLLIPAIQAAREAGRRNTCLNNQRQVGTAVVNYVTSKDRFPPLYSVQPNPTIVVINPPLRVGWVPPLLSYLEQNPLYQAFQNFQWGGLTGAQVSTLICPSRAPTSTPAPLSYVVNAGVADWFTDINTTNPPMDYAENGVFFDEYAPAALLSNTLPKAPIIDMSYLSKRRGAVRTLLCSESLDAQDWIKVGTAVPAMAPIYPDDQRIDCKDLAITWQIEQPPTADWGMTVAIRDVLSVYPGPATSHAFLPSSNHSGGFIVTYCDGHSQFMSSDIAYRIYCLLMMTDPPKARDPAPIPGGNPFVLPSQWYTSAIGYGNLVKPVTDADLGG